MEFVYFIKYINILINNLIITLYYLDIFWIIEKSKQRVIAFNLYKECYPFYLSLQKSHISFDISKKWQT